MTHLSYVLTYLILFIQIFSFSCDHRFSDWYWHSLSVQDRNLETMYTSFDVSPPPPFLLLNTFNQSICFQVILLNDFGFIVSSIHSHCLTWAWHFSYMLFLFILLLLQSLTFKFDKLFHPIHSLHYYTIIF